MTARYRASAGPISETLSRGLLPGVLSRWPLILVAALPLALGVAGYAQERPAYYTASTVVAFQPRGSGSVGADVFRAVLPRYVAYLSSGDTEKRVQSALGESSDRLPVDVQVEVPADTANLNISARRSRPERAAEVANAFAQAALQYNRRDGLLVAQQVAPAFAPRRPAGPRRTQFYAAGLIAGLAFGVGLAALFERWRPRVRLSQESVEGVQVVARFPEALPGGSKAWNLTDLVSGPSARVLALQAVAAGGPLAKVLGVTALRESAGTSAVAAALAAASVGDGRSVLLVLRSAERQAALALGASPSPSAAERVGRPGQTGRSSATVVPGLRVLAPADDEWSSQELSAIVASVQRDTDMVVVECPPLAAVDSQVLVTAFEEVVLVASSDSLCADVHRARVLLDRLGVSLRGVVLTRRHLGRALALSSKKHQAPT